MRGDKACVLTSVEGILFFVSRNSSISVFLKKGFHSKSKDSDIGRHVIGVRY